MKIVGIFSLLVLSGCFAQNNSEEQQDQDIANTSQIITQEAIAENSGAIIGDDVMQVESTSMDETIQAVESSQASDSIEQKGIYADYKAELIGDTDATVIFFAASWCPSCVAADTNLVASYIPSGVTILKADFDADLELRREYGVVAQHTFVSVDSDGNQLRKWVGGTTIDDITEKL